MPPPKVAWAICATTDRLSLTVTCIRLARNEIPRNIATEIAPMMPSVSAAFFA